MNESVLVVEDDASIREIVSIGLANAGYSVATATDGRDAVGRARSDRPDAIILDVMLPSLDGFDALREIRKFSQVPVLMLTARTDTVDAVVGLESGADDYVTKPFEMPELVARLRSVLRRATADRSELPLRVGDIDVDVAGYVARRDGKELPLTATEFRLLVELARQPGRVFTRQNLLQQVWGYDSTGDDHLVDVAIQRLRAKVDGDPQRPSLIRTVRGVGYRLERS